MKRIIAFTLLCLILLIPVHAQPRKVADFKVSPFFEGRLTAADLKNKLRSAKAPAVVCTSYAELVALITEQGKLRNESFTAQLSFNFQFDDLQTLIPQAVYDATTSDDYLLFSVKGRYFEGEGVDNNATVSFQLAYFTTLAQEQYVTMRIAAILSTIITDDMTDLQKEKAVHDWIIQNVQYEEKTGEDYQYYSAYDGLYRKMTVCNGYALLMYRMINALGMKVRIVAGYGAGVLHAWNLVYLCGNWYHTDATWDDPDTDTSLVNYDFFNLSDAEITSLDHTIGANPEFYPDVPDAPVTFDGTACSAYTRPGTPPLAPVLSTPASGSTDISLLPSLAAQAFSDVDGNGTHWKSLWQISLDAAFTQCIYYDTSLENLTAFDIPAQDSLPDNKTLYWRVRYFDTDLNPSAWSSVFSFTTVEQSTVPLAPVPLNPADGVTISVKPRLITEAFADQDRWDTHASTQWQLSTASDFSELYLDHVSETDLLTLAFTNRNLLPELTTFYWRVRHMDNDGVYSPWSETRSFTTKKVPDGSDGTTDDSGCFIGSSMGQY